MFNKKKEDAKGNMMEDIARLTKDMAIREIMDDIVECKKCGCLLKKNTAHKVNVFVDEHTETVPIKMLSNTAFVEEHEQTIQAKIEKEYYCKIHKPKAK